METDLQTNVAFYLTGKIAAEQQQLQPIAGRGLRPALFATRRELDRLRYDFPLVLVEGEAGEAPVASLSAVFDGILERIAHGSEADRLRKHALRLEREIRARVAAGARGKLSALWDALAPTLVVDDALFADSLQRARTNLRLDGEVVDCGAGLARQVFLHTWKLAQKRRAAGIRNGITRRLQKLADILQAEYANSEAGKSASNLRQAFGGGPFDQFNFDAMSDLLNKAARRAPLPRRRRERINNLMSALREQRFFALDDSPAKASELYPFAFDSCSAALAAYRERLPAVIDLARAVAVADLEIKSEYCETKHDKLFAGFGENGLGRDEIELFPDYLVCLEAAALSAEEQAALTEILAANLPIKILVQTDDVIEPSPIAQGHLAFTLKSRQLAGMAMGLGEVFVLQAPASALYALRESVGRGLDYVGPALFSVYSGASPHTAGIPPYLVAAAALEARAFPAFCYDPAAGDDLASRFSLAGNPQAQADWPEHEFAYQDEFGQTVKERLAFTLLDFVACDTRYAGHFACIAREHWAPRRTPAAELLAADLARAPDQVPSLLAVDADAVLNRLIVDEKLMREARRCRTLWHSLQELGGINNSHAARFIAAAAVTAAATAPAVEAAPAASEAPPAPAEPEAEVERSADEPYIETARCSSCNECITLNGKLFVYDANRQAMIADLKAGTYAQLVEAAENCPVSVIHPGKPRNPNEPGLDDLIKRAAAFQ